MEKIERLHDEWTTPFEEAKKNLVDYAASVGSKTDELVDAVNGLLEREKKRETLINSLVNSTTELADDIVGLTFKTQPEIRYTVAELREKLVEWSPQGSYSNNAFLDWLEENK